MQNYLISVIIPYYNTSKFFFDACIKSLQEQTFKHFEIIVVDDGSEVEYGEYLDECSKRDSRIKVWHINNQGVSVARNFGLEKAFGDTVCFVDSDDYVAPWMLEDLWNAYKNNHTDASVARYKMTQKDTFAFQRNNIVTIVDSEEMLKTTLVGMNCNPGVHGYLSAGPVAVLFNRNYAKSIVFPSGVKYMEDVIWNYIYFSKTQKTAVVDECVYAYRQNNESATHSYRIEMINERVKALRIIEGMSPIREWYALRSLANYAMCCKCIMRTRDINTLKTRIDKIRELNGLDVWSAFKERGINANWDRKFRIKRWLALNGLLPFVYHFKEF